MVWLQAGFHAVVDHKHLKGREGGERRQGKGKEERLRGTLYAVVCQEIREQTVTKNTKLIQKKSCRRKIQAPNYAGVANAKGIRETGHMRCFDSPLPTRTMSHLWLRRRSTTAWFSSSPRRRWAMRPSADTPCELLGSSSTREKS